MVVMSTVETAAATHDTTGGMIPRYRKLPRLQNSESMCTLSTVKAATTHASRALSGELKGGIPDDWLGKPIRFSNERSIALAV
ncbi:hypothetical protein TB1_020267 [Malus domestica]